MKHTQPTDNLKKIWISLSKAKKLAELIDETYYNLCTLKLYWSTYRKLQSVHIIINNLLDGDHVEEEELDYLYWFIRNHSQFTILDEKN